MRVWCLVLRGGGARAGSLGNEREFLFSLAADDGLWLTGSSVMDETGQEEVRPGSGASDNGSEEGGFVEVTREDAQLAAQSWEQPSPVGEDLDLLGDVDRAVAERLEDEEKVSQAATPRASCVWE